MELGFIGLGLMGAPMAERLIGNDATLHVYDPNPGAVSALTALGAVGHPSAASVADAGRIVFACLPTPAVSEQSAGEVAGGSAIEVYVEMSTVGRPCIERVTGILAERQILVVDAPISGGPKGAREGGLSIMAAGSPEAIAKVRPWLLRIGSEIFEVHPEPGRGQVMKLVNNLISAAIMASTYESLVLGTKSGLDPDKMVEVLNASSARNSATLRKVPEAILTGTFDFGATVRTITKDVELGIAEAHNNDVPMWVGENILQIWRFAKTQGYTDEDYTTLIQIMEKWGGVVVRTRSSL